MNWQVIKIKNRWVKMNSAMYKFWIAQKKKI